MYKNEIVYKRNRKKKCVEFNVFKSFFFLIDYFRRVINVNEE